MILFSCKMFIKIVGHIPSPFTAILLFTSGDHQVHVFSSILPFLLMNLHNIQNYGHGPQKMAMELHVCIKEVEGFFYPCSENKSAADLKYFFLSCLVLYCRLVLFYQLCSYHAADLRFCLRICKILVLS